MGKFCLEFVEADFFQRYLSRAVGVNSDNKYCSEHFSQQRTTDEVGCTATELCESSLTFDLMKKTFSLLKAKLFRFMSDQ